MTYSNPFHEARPLAGLRPAEYNPRALAPDRFDALRESLRRLGFLRPVICTPDGLLVAGHQRTRAAAANGLETVPAVVVPGTVLTSEIAFNMIHNAADVEHTDGFVTVPPAARPGWQVVPPSEVAQVTAPTSMQRRHEVIKLLEKHGDWGSAVATLSGAVVACQLHASATVVLRRPLLVRYVPDADAQAVKAAFSASYGEFSFAHIAREPWTASFAQPMRLRAPTEEATDRGVIQERSSVLYRTRVLPFLQPADRLFDLGAGQMDHCKALIRQGRQAFPVEFFLRKSGKMEIDPHAVRRWIERLCLGLSEGGLMDVAVADAVVNSVADNQAEADVLACLNAMTRPGGSAFFSTRSREDYERHAEARGRARGVENFLHFFDADGFTGTYQRGVWRMQKFHTRQDVERLARGWLYRVPLIGRHPKYWDAGGIVDVALPLDVCAAAIGREFNLAWPSGQSVGMSGPVLEAWREACKKDGKAFA